MCTNQVIDRFFSLHSHPSTIPPYPTTNPSLFTLRHKKLVVALNSSRPINRGHQSLRPLSSIGVKGGRSPKASH